MEIIISLLIFILGSPIVLGLMVLFLYNAAKNKQQASFVRGDTIEFVVAGETPIRVLENIKGWYYQKGTTTCKTRVGKIVGTVAKTLGDGTIKTVDKWELGHLKVLVADAIMLGESDYKHPPWWTPSGRLPTDSHSQVPSNQNEIARNFVRRTSENFGDDTG